MAYPICRQTCSVSTDSALQPSPGQAELIARRPFWHVINCVLNQMSSPMTSFRLDGLRALITAGGSGIGRVIAKCLFEAGARVHICDIQAKLLDACGGEFPGIGTTVADVSDDSAVDHLFADVQRNLGGLDVLVNNAGIAGPTGAIEDIDPKEWRHCIEVDLTGQFLVARRAVPMLKANGSGIIINMSSAP